MAAGRSFAQVDEMTFFDVSLIFDYWVKHPPANEILSVVYQVEPGEKKVETEKPKEGMMSIEELKESFQKMGGLKLVQKE